MKDRIKLEIEKEGLSQNLKLLNKAYITTFDSYALSIVKKYHYILNLSPNISIEEGGILKLQAKKILDEIMEEKYEQQDPKFVSFITDFCLKDDEDLKKNLLNIYDKLELKIDKKSYLNQYLNTYYNNDILYHDVQNYVSLMQEKIANIKNLLQLLSSDVEESYYKKIIEALSPLLESTTYDEIKHNSTISLPMLPKNSSNRLKELKEKISKQISELNELSNFDDENQKRHSK